MEALLVEYEGRQVTIAEASELSGIPYGTIYGRIQRGTPLFKKKNEYKAGDHHYRLTLLEPVNSKRPSMDWIMRCDCGELTKAGACEVRTGRIRSCGCLLKDTMRELQLGVAKVDLTKQKFNKLRVLRQVENVSIYYAGCVWECECECGNIVNVPTSRLTTGHTKSCGCLKEATQSAEFMELIRPIAKKKYLAYQEELENV